jgi:hypothetical protein
MKKRLGQTPPSLFSNAHAPYASASVSPDIYNENRIGHATQRARTGSRADPQSDPSRRGAGS